MNCLKLLNEHHMKAENNTGCYYRYAHKDNSNIKDTPTAIEFKEHHVSMITASDAHKPDHVGSFIKEIWNNTHGINKRMSN